MDADTVAGLLGVSSRQLNNYINKNGLPTQGEGKRRTFVWSEVLAWFVRYKLATDKKLAREIQRDDDEDESGLPDLNKSERRRASYMADLKGIELQKAQGALVPMADVSRVLQDVATGLRTDILGWPTRIVGSVLGQTERPVLFALLTSEAELLCARLSQLKFVPKIEVPADDEELDDRGEDEGE